MWLVPNPSSLRSATRTSGHPDELDTDEHPAEYEEDEEEDHRVAHLLSDHRQLASVAAICVLGVVAIYVVLPKVVGFDESLDKIHDAKWYWVVVAVGFCVAPFVAYVALFRGVLGGRSRPRCAGGSTSRPRTRSPWPGWRPRASSRRPAPAASCSPTGRCARRACPGAARPAGWWPSSC